MSFWPDEINANDILSPTEIMQKAGEELRNRTGTLSVSIRETTLEDRVVLSFDVINQVSSARFCLFEASHRIGEFYPVVILPPDANIPEFLKRKRYVPGNPGLLGFSAVASVYAAMGQGTPGRYVENKWVCATPSEFERKLIELFAEDFITWRITSLRATKMPSVPTEPVHNREQQIDTPDEDADSN